jgi:ABC-type dipeptide/oligopeptide/nickel transport system permease component
VLKHGLRNALIPVLTLFGVLLAQLVTNGVSLIRNSQSAS